MSTKRGKKASSYVQKTVSSNNDNKPNHQPLVNLNDSSKLTQIVCLYLGNEQFDIDATLTVIKSLKNERLIYSEISNYLFTQAKKSTLNSRDDVATFVSNVDTLKEFVLNPNNSEYSDMKPVVLKLYDHIQLANHQVNMFKVGQEQFDTYLKSSDFINQKIESVNSQVVSLVALFTAMSFLVFGGLASFESIFSNIQETSLLKLIVLSSVWGIAIINTIGIFMFFTSKVVGKSFSKSSSEKDTLYNRYPYITLGNYILLLIFFTSSLLYLYIKQYGYNLPQSFSQCKFFIIFLSCIFLFFLLSGYFVFFHKKTKTSEE